MSLLGDAIGRPARKQPPGPVQPPAAPAQRSHAGEPSELRRRRDALAAEVTELHWDLGGLAYEMAIRDHFRLDVLLRRAAVLQERDAELAEVERLLLSEQSGAAGACPTCAAPHSRGALFCWQCGIGLMERSSSAALGRAAGSTAVTDALLAPEAATTSDDD